jgi:hypothetical protein
MPLHTISCRWEADRALDMVLVEGTRGRLYNWAIHCTVSKRYEVAHDYRDECIGFRLVLSAD